MQSLHGIRKLGVEGPSLHRKRTVSLVRKQQSPGVQGPGLLTLNHSDHGGHTHPVADVRAHGFSLLHIVDRRLD